MASSAVVTSDYIQKVVNRYQDVMASLYEYARYRALVGARIFASDVQKSHVISVNALVFSP